MVCGCHPNIWEVREEVLNFEPTLMVNDETLPLFLKAHKRKVQPLITVLAGLQDLQRKYIHTAVGLAMQSPGLPCAFLSLNPSLSELEKSLPIDMI